MGLRKKDFGFFAISGGVSLACLLMLPFVVGFHHEDEKFKHFFITLVLVMLVVLFVLEPLYLLAVALNHIGTPKPQPATNKLKEVEAQQQQEQPERYSGGMAKHSTTQSTNVKLTRTEYLQHLVQSLKSQSYIAEEHRHESQNLRFQHVASEMLLLLGYFIILLLLVVGYRTELTYYNTRVAEDIIMPAYYDWMGTTELDVLNDIYEFVERSLINTFQTNTNQGVRNDSLREMGWFHGDVSRLLGVVRLHQVRYADKHVGRNLPQFLNEKYMPGWKLPYKNHLYQKQHWRIFEPWLPRSLEEHSWFLSNSYKGEILEYPLSGGYVVLLARSKQNSMVILDFLREKKWLDAQTALVSIDFTLYNVDANMFTVITVLAEQTLFGKLVSQTQVRSCKLLLTLDDLTFGGLLLMMMYAMMFVSFCRALVVTAWYHPRFLSSVWHIMDCLIVLLNIVLILALRQREFTVLNMIEELDKSEKTDFVDFRIPASLDSIITSLAGLLVAVTSLCLWRTLHFDRTFTLFTRALWTAARPLASVTCVTFILLCGFSISAYVISGNDSKSFVRLVKSFISTLSLPMRFNADVNPRDLNFGGYFLGFLLYCTLMVTVSIFLTNIFITLVCDYTVRTRVDLRKQEKQQNKLNLTYLQFLYMEYLHQFRQLWDGIEERLRLYWLHKRSQRATVAEQVEEALYDLEQQPNVDFILKLRYAHIKTMENLNEFLQQQRERDHKHLERINMKGIVIMAQFELISKELERLRVRFKVN